MATSTPAQRSHTFGVNDTLLDQVIDTCHDVVEAESEIVTYDVRPVSVTVVRGPSVVRLKNCVASSRVDLRIVSTIESQLVCRRRAPVNRNDEGVACSF